MLHTHVRPSPGVTGERTVRGGVLAKCLQWHAKTKRELITIFIKKINKIKILKLKQKLIFIHKNPNNLT